MSKIANVWSLIYMQTFSATEAKNNLGLVFDSAQKCPVSVKKQGRPYVYVLSKDAYETLEDAFWILKAKEAEEEGFLSAEESKKFFDSI